MGEKGALSTFLVLAVLLVVAIPVILLKGNLINFDASSIQVATPGVKTELCVENKEAILSLVSAFELKQQERNVTEVFNMFTKASNNEEAVILRELRGSTSGESPTLYQPGLKDYATTSFKVLSSPVKASENSCETLVEELRSYRNQNTQAWDPPAAMKFKIFTIQEGGKWMIDMYENQAPGVRRGKYSGFLMEYLPD